MIKFRKVNAGDTLYDVGTTIYSTVHVMSVDEVAETAVVSLAGVESTYTKHQVEWLCATLPKKFRALDPIR
jgi:hypothetical protein